MASIRLQTQPTYEYQMMVVYIRFQPKVAC